VRRFLYLIGGLVAVSLAVVACLATIDDSLADRVAGQAAGAGGGGGPGDAILEPAFDSVSEGGDADAGDEADAGAEAEARADALAEADGCSAVFAPPVRADGGPCPSDMVTIALDGGLGYCIDRTEVTVAAYGQFLDAHVPACAQPPQCLAWNLGFAPDAGPDADVPPADWPVRYVNWCDAYVYCRWVGKRLCGKIGGGPIDVWDIDAANNAAVSQWFNACSGGGAKTYPYGDTFDAGACVVDKPQPAAAEAGRCEGAYPGLLDMSGNVAEWIDLCGGSELAPNCTQDAGSCTYCWAQGGYYSHGEPQSGTRCASDTLTARGAARDIIGFRCCAD
jgi:formylglycine-generating enzyme required for sulfatase activity